MTTRYPITNTSIVVPTAAGTSLLTAADAAAQRTSLALGSLATASSVDLTTQASGTLPVAQGGTGSTTAAAARTALGVPRSLTLYASDATAENGSGTASLSGTGASSTFTLSVSNATVAYTTTATTSPRILLPIPQGAMRIECEIGITAASGLTSNGSIYFAAGLRPSGGGTPARLWGASWNDVTSVGPGYVYWGNLSTGTNNTGAGGFSTTVGIPAANRWLRLVLETTTPWVSPSFGTGTSGARPSTFAPQTNLSIPNNGTFYSDTIGADTQLAIWIQTFDNRSPAITATATTRVLVW